MCSVSTLRSQPAVEPPQSFARMLAGNATPIVSPAVSVRGPVGKMIP